MKRTVTLDLLDEDAKCIFNMAAENGLTVAELIENFLGDLACGNRRNGSDECDRARSWFDRCWFGMFPEYTFTHFLLSNWQMEYFLSDLEFMDDMLDGIQEAEDEEEKAAYQLDYDCAKEEVTNYYNEYVANCPKDEKPQSYEDALAGIRKYKKDLEMWVA